MKALAWVLIVALPPAWIGMGSCSRKEKANTLGDIDAFADLFFDLAQATQQCTTDTAALRQKHEAVLQAHHISPTVVEQALREYRQHPEQWIRILQKMSEKEEKASPRENENRTEGRVH